MNKKLLQQLYEKYRKELYLYICSLCHDTVLADDLLQETFLKAILSLSDNHTNMRAWLYMVARNLYFNYAKKESKKVYIENENELENEVDTDLLDRMIFNDKKKVLYQALNHLPEKKREILTLQYFGELSQKEIAAVLHITPENVRVLAYRAKCELKTYMEEKGYDI